MSQEEQVIEQNKELIEKYPFLFPRNVWTDKEIEGYDYSWTLYDEIPIGWRIAFGEMLLEDLKESLVKYNCLEEFRFSQIKEKYGQLCLYNFGAPEETHDIIRDYEVISQYVCIHCGSPYACIVNDYGWYLPACKCCWDKQQKKRENDGLNTISYEMVKSDVCEIPNTYSYKYYSGDEVKEVTVDISDKVKKIKDIWNMKYKEG